MTVDLCLYYMHLFCRGGRADGAAWRETWREAIAFDQANGEPLVERSAHKWARDGKVPNPDHHDLFLKAVLLSPGCLQMDG